MILFENPVDKVVAAEVVEGKVAEGVDWITVVVPAPLLVVDTVVLPDAEVLDDVDDTELVPDALEELEEEEVPEPPVRWNG